MTDDALDREFTRQYARAWRLLREKAQELGPNGFDLLFDIANLRQRDIEKLRKGEPMRGSQEAAIRNAHAYATALIGATESALDRGCFSEEGSDNVREVIRRLQHELRIIERDTRPEPRKGEPMRGT